MKKQLLLSALIAAAVMPAAAQTHELDGRTILESCDGRKISYDGTQVIATTDDYSTIYYNTVTNEAIYFPQRFGQGYVVADNGWIVGQEQSDYGDRAVIMKGKNDVFYPSLAPYLFGDIHSITPDASRVCGVVQNNGAGMTYFPFVSDLDEFGNLVKINVLPYPEKDFFGFRPQYCSATWMSADGKTIAGQVVDSRGFFVYPILYKENEEGEWECDLPTEDLFNPNKLPIPEPLGDIEEVFPDAPYPEITDFMTPENAILFQEALNEWESNNFADELDPYQNIWLFMTQEEANAYNEAVDKYLEAGWKYEEMFENYMKQLYEITDSSVFFVRNAMCLSKDGKWLSASASVDNLSDPENIITHYVPYLINLETFEATKIGVDNENLIPHQVFEDGRVLMSTQVGGLIPACSSIYLPEQKALVNILDYIDEASAEWIRNNFTTDIPVGVNPNGGYEYRTVTISGLMAASEDFSVISSGIDGYAFDLDDYLTFILKDVSFAGVDRVMSGPQPVDGIYRVYNLQGVNVMSTRDASQLNSLPKGIYVVNGKKTVIR